MAVFFSHVTHSWERSSSKFSEKNLVYSALDIKNSEIGNDSEVWHLGTKLSGGTEKRQTWNHTGQQTAYRHVLIPLSCYQIKSLQGMITICCELAAMTCEETGAVWI